MGLHRLVAAGVRSVACVCFALAAQTGGPAESQGTTPSSPSPPPASRIEDQIARSIAATRPGPEQQSLEPLVGSWKMQITSYSASQQPLHQEGTSENRWILGGRFLLSESSAGEGATRVEATTVYGYDARERKFFTLGLNNLGTGYSQWSGTYDPGDRSFILSAKERSQATGAAQVFRQQLRVESDGRYSLRVFLDLPGRRPTRVVEATFTRR